jgi:hypothetical protein
MTILKFKLFQDTFKIVIQKLTLIIRMFIKIKTKYLILFSKQLKIINLINVLFNNQTVKNKHKILMDQLQKYLQ